MSGRGIDFLENWVNKNVTDADRKDSQVRAGNSLPNASLTLLLLALP
jgi:hypothetical protein